MGESVRSRVRMNGTSVGVSISQQRILEETEQRLAEEGAEPRSGSRTGPCGRVARVSTRRVSTQSS
ncbi:MAG: hypothetical protein M3N24_04600, partial [Actinomycetota bacterium]|nr:hypothetical protein [Actinomycetota bacterium]